MLKLLPPHPSTFGGENIPVYIKNTFAPEEEGTLVNGGKGRKNDQVVKGISHIDEVSLVSLEGSGMIGIPVFKTTVRIPFA